PQGGDVYKTAIVDAELDVLIDLDQKAGVPISKLTDNRYLATGTSNGNLVIVDKNLDYVTEASSKYDIYQTEGLIKFRADGKYGFIDYDGKIKVEPVYNTIGDFYGDYTYASRTVKGKTEYFFINKNSSVTAAPKSDVESGKEVDVRASYYRVVTSNEEEPGYTVDFYTFDGTHLVQLENITNTYNITVNGKLVIADGVCYALKY
ncbi:MAG: WG repeat-containing protein, partial [Clostridiales bacterium]|nr:WG repeat-containing protein [Clostridiales bacterium]